MRQPLHTLPSASLRLVTLTRNHSSLIHDEYVIAHGQAQSHKYVGSEGKSAPPYSAAGVCPRISGDSGSEVSSSSFVITLGIISFLVGVNTECQ